MVGGNHAHPAVPGEFGAIDVIEERRAAAEFENKALVGAGLARRGDGAGATQDRGNLGDPGNRLRQEGCRKHGCVAPASQPFFGQRDGVDHPLIGLAGTFAKGEDAVLQQHQALDIWVFLEHLGGFFGELKPGHDVGHEPQPARIKLGATFGGVGLVGEAQHRGRMGMIDKFVRQKGVQQGLDRRVGGAGIDQVRALRANHFRVGQCLAPAQFAQRREPNRREPGRFDRRHVPAAALDAQHLGLLVEQVLDDGLDRGVAAAVQHQLGVAPQQPRGVNAQRDVPTDPPAGIMINQPRGLCIGPLTVHRRTSRSTRSTPIKCIAGSTETSTQSLPAQERRDGQGSARKSGCGVPRQPVGQPWTVASSASTDRGSGPQARRGVAPC